MLELTGFGCRAPGRLRTVDDLTLTADSGSITAVVGRSGSGGSTLVRTLAGAVDAARTRGTAMLNGQRIDGATRDELAAAVLWISDEALPGGTVADCLRVLTGGLTAADELGLEADLDRRLSALPVDLRLRLHCASLLPRSGTTAAPLVLVDRVMGAADVSTRDRFCSLLRDRARAGAAVLWAAHDLDAVWEYADHVVELDGGRVAWQGRPETWRPRTLPEPTLLTLARALDVPPADCRTPQQTAQTLETSSIVLPLFPHRSADGASPAGTGAVIDAAAVGLGGPAIEVRPGECLGIIDTSGRPEALARRLVAHLPGGDVVPSQLPQTLRVRTAARAWERRHNLPAGAVLAHLPTLRPRALLLDLSPGELALFRRALAGGPTTPLWLPHPQAGLDPRERHTLAEDLRRRPVGTRLITSRDVEFLVRACHRLLVVAHDVVIADGSPSAVADLMPSAPLVSRAVGSTRYLRLTDVLSTTATMVNA